LVNAVLREIAATAQHFPVTFTSDPPTL